MLRAKPVQIKIQTIYSKNGCYDSCRLLTLQVAHLYRYIVGVNGEVQMWTEGLRVASHDCACVRCTAPERGRAEVLEEPTNTALDIPGVDERGYQTLRF